MNLKFLTGAALALPLMWFATTKNTTPQAKAAEWNKAWTALQSKTAETGPTPENAKTDGPPVRDGDAVLFRFQAPSTTAKVYLAGSFNRWARNKGGHISDPQYEMRAAGDGIWYRRLNIAPQVHQYKFVVLDKNGKFDWLPDPHVNQKDSDGNSTFDFSTVVPTAKTTKTIFRKTLKPFSAPAADKTPILDTQTQSVWVRPDQTNTLLVTVNEKTFQTGARISLTIETPFGQKIHESTHTARSGENRIPVPALNREGGFVTKVALTLGNRVLAKGDTVVSVVKNIADDLRYGFYTSFRNMGENYGAKADMLARLHVNAVEFYDYFPAHGLYAPREADYKFEPFGIPINARDIQQKIDSGHERNILSLAYVAAYAASESVYRKHPYPMTNEKGEPKVYNGQIMSDAEADAQKKPKWFWLMNVADDSPWHKYILEEFGRTLDKSPNDFVSFDGFEIDTYGDSDYSRFYAKGSRRDGDLLRDVLRDFVGDVQKLTHRIKPHGLVSFNSVNEFGVEQMYDVTDFLFLEIWRAHTDQLEELTDICFRHRAPKRQRVVLKVYPADMESGKEVWPANALRRVLGATMTGAGSLMVVGEPDETKGEMHALRTLYYPDHKAIPKENENILRDYYRHDAMLYGYTHGADVYNAEIPVVAPDCIVRTYAAPKHKAVIVQLLNQGNEKRWSADAPITQKRNQEIIMDLPGGATPDSVLFTSPDSPNLQKPVVLDFEVVDGKLRILLPELQVHGTLILQYS